MNESSEDVYRDIPEKIGNIEPGQNAVLWSRSIGRGNLVYFSRGLGEMMYRIDHPAYIHLLDEMIFPDDRITLLISTNAPSTVEVTLNRVQDGILFHMVNSTGKTPSDEVVSITGLKVEITIQVLVSARVYQPDNQYATRMVLEVMDM